MTGVHHVRRRRWLAALLATGIGAASVVVSTAGGVEARDRCDGRKEGVDRLLECVKVGNILDHLKAFQRIADSNGGNRAASQPGYDASVAYVESRLERAGYDVELQDFEFESFDLSVLEQTSPDPISFEYGSDFLENTFTPVVPEGTASGTLVPVDVAGPDSGCDAADFTGFPAGSIALIKRGTCGFADKALNADAAGAAGVVIYNDGAAPDRFGLISMIGDTPGLDIPAVFATFEVGDMLASDGPREITVTVEGEIRTTTNVLAELPGRRNNDSVIMAGAHLDSVTVGPGINDNGSGSAALLETAIQMSENRPRNTVRFAWWGAEEEGLLGSEFYVGDLTFDEQLEIELYLNFDMVGSTNFVRFILDGDGSEFGTPGPIGSDRIEALFAGFFEDRSLPTEETAFDGRSDYGPFIAVGIPSGGLFTGAEGIKTPEQAAIFGGTAGEQYDPCYHEACDTSRNVNRRVLHQNADAMAFATLRYSKARHLPGDPGQRLAAAVAAAFDAGTLRAHDIDTPQRVR